MDLVNFSFDVGSIRDIDHFPFWILHQLAKVPEIGCVSHRYSNNLYSLMSQQPVIKTSCQVKRIYYVANNVFKSEETESFARKESKLVL